MIEGKTINLRTWRSSDLDTLSQLVERIAEFGDYWPRRIMTRSSINEFYNAEGNWSKDKGSLILTDKENRIIGFIAFFQHSDYVDGYEIGYRIFKPEDWGKGYMAEALRLFSAYLFDIKNIPRLSVNVFKGNAASRRVAEKNGFVLEGTLRKACFHHGKYYDLELLGLLREDCPSLDDVMAEMKTG